MVEASDAQRARGLKPRAAKNPERAAELARAAAEMASAIEAMSANGLSPQQISLLTNIKPDRLYRRYRDSMMRGGARRTHEVAESAFKMAVGGPERDWRRADAGMAKFWLERMGGPSWGLPERDAKEGPDLSRLTVPQLIELEKALRPLARGPALIDVTPEPGDADARTGDGGVIEAGAGDLADRGDGGHIAGSGGEPG